MVEALLRRGKSVRALVRPSSSATALEERGVSIVRGDMLDLESLVRAMDGVDAVITTAAGYTRHSKGDSTDIDTIGNANLAEAAHRAGVRRFVLTSILTCDQTPQIPHFWHKKLAEDQLQKLGVPFVALRPGAFLDQVSQIGGDQFEKRRLTWVGSKSVPMTFVLTSDLAEYLAAAVDADGIDSQRIDIGWDRPVNVTDLAAMSTAALGSEVKIRAIPAALVGAIGAVVGPFAPMVKDMAAMMTYFATGKYVADTTRQSEVFGTPPTAEASVRKLLRELDHSV